MKDDEILKNYEIKEIIGQGATGRIFKAFDKINKRECALKIIDKAFINKSNEKDYLLNSINNEIKIQKLCKSKNIVELYDSFETKESIALAMELTDNNLEKYIKKYIPK